MAQAPSVRDVLNEAADRLRAAGIGTPLTDARILLAHALGVPLSRLDLLMRSPLDVAVLDRFRFLTAQRATRRPLAYVVGSVEFMGLRFRCDERALVPRPETEVLVEAVYDALTGREPCGREVILDVGTGSGVIGVSLAVLLPGARVILTDVSSDALSLARENGDALAVAERVRLLQGRDLDPVVATGFAEEITCVVSNPPYVAPEDASALPPEVAEYESRAAWLGEGDAGTGFYERFIPQCASCLPNVRVAAFEVGIGQATLVRRLCADAWPTFEARILKDLSGIDRVVITQRS